MSGVARQVRLRQRPQGQVRAEDFEVAEVTLPPLGDGDILVRNEWMSIDPYMRLVLTGQEGFAPQKQPGDAMDGTAIGTVVESRDPAFAPGSHVLSAQGWRSHFVAKAEELAPVASNGIPLHWHLGVLGLTGVTAYLGIERVLEPQAGETVLVSGASGAVGSVAVQLAKLRGARVLGTCSSPEKAAWLLDVAGIDAVGNYEAEPLDDFLRREAPSGIDCYFDNVGGAMLETVLQAIKPQGRIGVCGAMSQYESGEYRHGPANFFAVIEKSLTVRGFNAFLLTTEENSRIVEWLAKRFAEGQLVPCETIIAGLEHAPEAFEKLFGSGYVGKALIKI